MTTGSGTRTVHVTRGEGVATVTLDRPPLNVLTIAMLDELDGALAELERISDLRLVVIRGAGRAFSAGVDVGEHRGDSLVPMLDAFARVAARLVDYQIPTLAVVHGAALGGGCELVTLCDLALVTEDARLGTPEITLGVVPPVGAALFPGLVGRQLAAALVLTGEPLSGAQAAAAGLVWRSVPAASIEEELARVTALFQQRSAASLRLAKRTMRVAADARTVRDAIDAADQEQRRSLPRIADADEGLRAFLEKRPPRWQHR